MHFGLVLECDYREDATQEEAFEEAFAQAEMAEAVGLDGVWLAERHFAAPRGLLGAQAAGIPSIASAPLVMASAIAARTRKLRLGVAVNILPLCHPIRMAEEAATVDHVSQGRFDFGVGRSSFVRAYEGYGVPYDESRDRFQECLDVIVRAWTSERFSYQGNHYSFDNVCVLPKPYQKPHPPIRIAATTKDTFPRVGSMGYPIFVGLRGMDQGELAKHLEVYRDAWRQAGHPGDGDVFLRVPVYVAETEQRAYSEPEASTMRSFQRMANSLVLSAATTGTQDSQERAERATRMMNVTYDELLRERVVYGTPQTVVERISALQEGLKLSGIIVEMNVGGLIAKERVLNSLRRFGEEVVPQFNSG